MPLQRTSLADVSDDTLDPVSSPRASMTLPAEVIGGYCLMKTCERQFTCEFSMSVVTAGQVGCSWSMSLVAWVAVQPGPRVTGISSSSASVHLILL